MTVAAILTCYNEGRWIEAALTSVLDQTAADRISEIVLVDDGSAPETLAALDRLTGRDPRLKIIKGPGGWGVSRARNHGVEATTAPLLAFLDGDDAWAPDKLARQLAVLEAGPEIDFIYTGYEAVTLGEARGPAVAVFDLGQLATPLPRYVRDDTTILPSSLLLRRSAFERAGGFDTGYLIFEDKEFFMRLLSTARPRGMPQALIRKMYRSGSLSAPRPELMGEHASILFRAALANPAIAPLVRHHLAQRAAKLGLVVYYGAELEKARRYLALARAMKPTEPRTLLLTALLMGGPLARRLLAKRLDPRRRLHGRIAAA